MPIWMIVVAAFIVGVAGVAGIVAGAAKLPGYLMSRRIDQRMRESTLGIEADATPTLVKVERVGALPGVEQLLKRLKGGALSRLIEQSGSKISATVVVLGSLVCAGVFGFVGAAL